MSSELANTTTAAAEAASEALANLRVSIDPTPASPPTKAAIGIDQRNGLPHQNGTTNSTDLHQLQDELERTRAEKDVLANQYRSLLEKLTQMRTTLGNKLKQDAEELDRREQLVHTLTAQNEDLLSTIDTLNSELEASNDEAERISRDLDAMRNRALQEDAHDASMRERDAIELERVRLERDEWERSAMQERVASEELRVQFESNRRELDMERAERDRENDELQREREKSTNLQSVLEDFQAVKELELKQAVAEYERHLRQTTTLLAEFKHRAYTAEEELASTSTNATLTSNLEKEVKEKNLLIGKLRHETVIINEHLTEALRRLRKTSSDSSVDRRLVTNVLLQFLTASRGDTKRFEMLSLLASILSWTDAERERAGLQRTGGAGSALAVGSPTLGTRRISGAQGSDLIKTDETESFSKMWVEFLLKESAQGASPTTQTSSLSPPTSPGPNMLQFGGRQSMDTPTRSLRMPSFGALGMTSSPNLLSPKFSEKEPPGK